MTNDPVGGYTDDDVEEARRPLASLLSKSRKAQGRLEATTWQYRMLDRNIEALEIASSLMDERPQPASIYTAEQLERAQEAMTSMIDRTQDSMSKFAAGTSQHTLQRNRLKALLVAQTFVRAAQERG